MLTIDELQEKYGYAYIASLGISKEAFTLVADAAYEKGKVEERAALLKQIEQAAWYRVVPTGIGKHRQTSECLCLTNSQWQSLKESK